MPIRRGKDTRVSGGSTPQETRRDTDPESLFSSPEAPGDGAPEDDVAKAGHHTEDDTNPSSAGHGQDDEGATRVVGPHGPISRRHAGEQPDSRDPMLDPPVGWLVIVRGPGKGRVLTLGLGLNIIGRSPDMRVCLDYGDNNISRTNHARIVYEPRKRQYLLSHGDGTNLTYLDNELVMTPVELGSGGEIQLGNTTLRFQAFCGSAFDWQDIDD